MPDIEVQEGKDMYFIHRGDFSTFIISKDEREELIEKLKEVED